MRRENVSPNTIATYGTACQFFAEWMIEQGHPTDMDAITSRHIEAWELALHEQVKSATVHDRHRGLQRFFCWYGAQTEDDTTWRNPMARMNPPRMERYAPRVLTLDELRILLGTCAGGGFEERRDEALIRMFFNTSARRAEKGGLRHSPTDTADRDIDMSRGRIKIVATSAKGRKKRTTTIDNDTVDALTKYLRERKKRPDPAEPWLWLGARGWLTDSGIAQAIRDAGQLGGPPSAPRS